METTKTKNEMLTRILLFILTKKEAHRRIELNSAISGFASFRNFRRLLHLAWFVAAGLRLRNLGKCRKDTLPFVNIQKLQLYLALKFIDYIGLVPAGNENAISFQFSILLSCEQLGLTGTIIE